MAKPWDDSMKMLVGDEIAGQHRLLEFQSIKLWEVPTDMLKQKGLVGTDA